MHTLRSLFLTMVLSTIAAHAEAGGLLGDLVKGVGHATGIQPLEKAGQELDNAHRNIKEAIRPYKAIEEGGSDFVRKRFLDACNATYQSVTAVVIGRCSNWDGRLDDQHIIQSAKQRLIASGLFQAREFDGIQIRWCPLQGAHGMAPDRGRIYLDTSAKSDHPDNAAALLAHEMTHIRQYRRMGTDQFKCEYSRKYVECGGCQNESHPLEREAYEFENGVYDRLTKSGWKMCNTSSHQKLFVAYSYKDDLGWVKEGWRKIERGQCSVLLQKITSRYVYYYAEADSSVWSGTKNLCVHPQNRFTHRSSTCDGKYELRAFRELDTGESTSWTTNLGD